MTRLRSNAPATHEVQVFDPPRWETGFRGSQVACAAELERASRHWPDRRHRVVTIEQAAADRRRKPWSVHDAGHVPVGSRVMLARPSGEIHPGMSRLARDLERVMGLPRDGADRVRTGVVESRDFATGLYMVRLDGTTTSTSVERSDVIYPVPANLIALEPGLRRQR